MKYCPKCDIDKNESEFHKRKASKDGYQYVCKECQVYRNLTIAQKSKRDSANTRYLKTEKGKRNNYKAQQKWRHTERGHTLTSISNRRSAAKRYERDPKYICLKNRAYKAGCSVGILKQVLQRDKICQLCHTDKDLQFDHIRPVSQGGKGSLKNLQLLCGPCNNFKSNHFFLPEGGMMLTGKQVYQ